MSAFDWTPELIADYIRDFAGAVEAELNRIEREMREVVQFGTTYRHRYASAADLMKQSTILTTDRTAAVLGFVQMRTASGAIYAGSVWADWETGEVSVTGWPLQPGTGGLT